VPHVRLNKLQRYTSRLCVLSRSIKKKTREIDTRHDQTLLSEWYRMTTRSTTQVEHLARCVAGEREHAVNILGSTAE
jgi:hypothetical protein